MTPAQRAALDTAKAKLREASTALRAAGLKIHGETGRACLAAAVRAADSADEIEDAEQDDHHTLLELMEQQPPLPLELRP